MKLIDRLFLFVNSRDRAVGAPNELIIPVQDIIRRIKGMDEIVRIYIQSFQIPNDFPRITESNNAFKYDGAVKTIPTGNPNVYQIQKALRDQGINLSYNILLILIYGDIICRLNSRICQGFVHSKPRPDQPDAHRRDTHK